MAYKEIRPLDGFRAMIDRAFLKSLWKRDKTAWGLLLLGIIVFICDFFRLLFMFGPMPSDKGRQ